MTEEEKKELADKVREAADKLNQATGRAVSAGLKVDLEHVERHSMIDRFGTPIIIPRIREVSLL